MTDRYAERAREVKTIPEMSALFEGFVDHRDENHSDPDDSWDPWVGPDGK